MKKIVLTALLHIAVLPLFAQMQGSRTVRVLDALTREPVVAATVQVENLPGGFLTDTLGQFHLSEKHLGQHPALTIRCIGYHTWTGELTDPAREIGRASCRERVSDPV